MQGEPISGITRRSMRITKHGPSDAFPDCSLRNRELRSPEDLSQGALLHLGGDPLEGRTVSIRQGYTGGFGCLISIQNRPQKRFRMSLNSFPKEVIILYNVSVTRNINDFSSIPSYCTDSAGALNDLIKTFYFQTHLQAK